MLEVVKLDTENRVNAIHIPCIKPFPAEAFEKLAKSAKKLIMVEGNSNGQAEAWIKQQTSIRMNDHLRRYDGRPFYAEDLLEYVSQQK